jgi:glycosyltransferase involved in cell wall biosynthesis
MVAQPGCHVVLVDYSCPDGSGHWARENFDEAQLTVVELPGRQRFDRSEAKNAAIRAAKTPWLCLIDADVVVEPGAVNQIRDRLHPDRFLRCYTAGEGVGGTIVAYREAVLRVGCHDPVYRDWGEEDDDLVDALLFSGQKPGALPRDLIHHLPHSDSARTRFHDHANRRRSQLVNRIYRAAKWDSATITGKVPLLPQRQALYDRISGQVEQAIQQGGMVEITLPLGKTVWREFSTTADRTLTYRVRPAGEDWSVG